MDSSCKTDSLTDEDAYVWRRILNGYADLAAYQAMDEMIRLFELKDEDYFFFRIQFNFIPSVSS